MKAKRKSPPKLAAKRARNVTKSWTEAVQRREEWQREVKKPIHIYRLETDRHGFVFSIAPGRIEAAGFVALELDLVSEPEEQGATPADVLRQIEELQRYVDEHSSNNSD